MKTGRLVVLIIGIMLISTLTADESYAQLQEKIDLLEAKLEKINTEQIDNNPYANGITRNWGAGFLMSSKIGSANSLDLELGYMFKIKGGLFNLLFGDYIGQRNSGRMGISAGVQWFDKEIVYKNNSTFYKSSGYGFFGKFNVESPILLNLISFSGHIKAMYITPEKDADHNIEDSRMVFGFGNDLGFWLSKNSCVTIGYTEEGEWDFDDNKNDRIYPEKIRFVFGVKTYF